MAAPNREPAGIDWEELPRLLHDLCDGHPGFSSVLYRLDNLWLCQSCYVKAIST